MRSVAGWRVAIALAMLGLAGAAQAVKLDAGFDGDGWKTIGFDPLTAGADFDRAYASCPGPDGTQIVSGMVRGTSGSDWIGVVRLRPDGSLDPAFGSAGRRFIALSSGGTFSFGHAALCVGGGRTVVARMVSGGGTGACWNDAGAECNLQLLRITAEGQLDPGFGTGGVTMLDLDDFRGGLAGGEAPLGLNRAASGELLLTGMAELAPAGGGQYRPFVARFSADGALAGASVPDLPGLSGAMSASGADYGPGGELWLVGDGDDASGQRVYYLGLLDAATLQPTATIRGGGGDHVLQGARLLRPGVLVAGSSWRAHGSSGPRTPRLVVFRQGGISTLDLPPSAPIDGVATGILSSAESIMPLDATHVLYGAQVVKRPAGGGFAHSGFHLALARIGATAAEDAALPADAATVSYRSPSPSCAGQASQQVHTRLSLWNGAPVLVGSATRQCNPDTDSDWLIARFTLGELFSDGFE